MGIVVSIKNIVCSEGDQVPIYVYIFGASIVSVKQYGKE